MVGSCTYSQLTSWILRSYSRNHSSDFHVCFLSQLQCSACHVVRERREKAGKNARQCSHSAAGLPDKQLCSCTSSLELQWQRGQHLLCICNDTTSNSNSSLCSVVKELVPQMCKGLWKALGIPLLWCRRAGGGAVQGGKGRPCTVGGEWLQGCGCAVQNSTGMDLIFLSILFHFLPLQTSKCLRKR